MADVTVLLTCAGQRVDIVRAFREALDNGGHDGRVLVSDLDPLSPSLFAADAVVPLPPVAAPGYGAAVAETGRRFRRTVLALGGSEPPMEIFKRFRGREPTTAALLRHSGLLAA